VLIDETSRLNEVLTRFLAFARPRPLEREEFDIAAEIEAVVALLRAQKEIRSTSFEIHTPSRGSTSIHGDREQLRQVLLNVLLNACQASGDNGSVSIHCETEEGLLHLRVHDSGYGFSPEALENAFTPFFTTKEQGTGLGLAISHRILESHGGRIRVSNADAGGGLVEAEIPLQRSG
jgi:two-component system sensor histidine kinase HydH